MNRFAIQKSIVICVNSGFLPFFYVTHFLVRKFGILLYCLWMIVFNIIHQHICPPCLAWKHLILVSSEHWNKKKGDTDIMNKELLLLEEICPILHIGKTTAYRLIQSDQLPAQKIGGKWQIRVGDLEKYLTGKFHRNWTEKIFSRKVQKQPI